MITTEHSGVSYRQSKAQARHMMFSFQYKEHILSNKETETAQNWKNYFKTIPGVLHYPAWFTEN